MGSGENMKWRTGIFLLLCALGAVLSVVGAQELRAAADSRGTADPPSAGASAAAAPAPAPASAPVPVPASVEDAWNLFEDSQEGFSLELPNEWVVIRPDMEKAAESYRKKLEAAAVPVWLIANLLQKASEGQRVTAVHSVVSGGLRAALPA
jgi:hypothetical protein